MKVAISPHHGTPADKTKCLNFRAVTYFRVVFDHDVWSDPDARGEPRR